MVKRFAILRAVCVPCFGMLVAALALAGCVAPGSSSARLPPRPPDSLLGAQIAAKVLIFVSNDCPICNRYSPELRRLHRLYAPRGCAFWLVHSDPDETAASIIEHDRQYGLSLPTLIDSSHRLVRLAQARVVPSVAVFAANGKLIYRGRIDDRFAQVGVERPQAYHHELEDALQAVLAGRPVLVAETQAVGCYLPEAQ